MRRSDALRSLGAAIVEAEEITAAFRERLRQAPEGTEALAARAADDALAGALVRVLPAYGLMVVLDDGSEFPS